ATSSCPSAASAAGCAGRAPGPKGRIGCTVRRCRTRVPSRGVAARTASLGGSSRGNGGVKEDRRGFALAACPRPARSHRLRALVDCPHAARSDGLRVFFAAAADDADGSIEGHVDGIVATSPCCAAVSLGTASPMRVASPLTFTRTGGVCIAGGKYLQTIVVRLAGE